MGREIKRVALDFEWPHGKVWGGFLMPDEVRLADCPDCKSGYSARAEELFDIWYGNAPFRPEDNGSVPLTPETPAVRVFAERQIFRSPEYYGSGESAIRREAKRFADLCNGQWSHHLNADDVTALLEADRLWDFTRKLTANGWEKPASPLPVPSPQQVNEWSLNGFGHDSINASVVVRARCKREGFETTCQTCSGSAQIGTEKQKEIYESWEPTEPPAGDGWQVWETVSEGSPVSPVFSTAEDLARFIACEERSERSIGSIAVMSYDNALRFVTAGWAPSAVSTGSGIELGYVAAGKDRS